MRTRLPYRLIAAALSLVMGLGVVLPVVQSVCASPLHASPMEARSHGVPGVDVSPSVSGLLAADAAGRDLPAHLRWGQGSAHTSDAQHASKARSMAEHDSEAHHDGMAPHAPPCEPEPMPCSDTCMTCCIVETDPAPWTTIRVVDSAFSTTVPRRFDTVTLIAPLGTPSPQPALEHQHPSSSPVRLHVWTATFLT